MVLLLTDAKRREERGVRRSGLRSELASTGTAGSDRLDALERVGRGLERLPEGERFAARARQGSGE